MTARYLENEWEMPYIGVAPMGILDIETFIVEIADKLTQLSHQKTPEFQSLKTEKSQISPDNWQVDFSKYIAQQTKFVSQASWFAQSVDCQNLLGKTAVVFGDSTHSAAITKILTREMGIRVLLSGTYCTHDADWFREQVITDCEEILITDDHTQVGDIIAQLEPSAIFGTQMERHIGKRLNIPCGVISAPVHIQNFPLGYRPFLGYEGSNQIADLIYNTFTLGMEDHLLELFGGHDTKEIAHKELSTDKSAILWSDEASNELQKIPVFVRNKVRQKTESFAKSQNYKQITLEVMYSAKQTLAS
jgi:light-independent protochlorophyllide reductase subunit B